MKNFAEGGHSESIRFRYPRYFDEHDAMHSYNLISSHAFTALTMAHNGTYKNESIMEAVDLYILNLGSEFIEDRILVCTDQRIIFVSDLKEILLNLKLKDIRIITINGEESREHNRGI